MNKDLTVGKPETVLWKFCLPLFGSIVFQQLTAQFSVASNMNATVSALKYRFSWRAHEQRFNMPPSGVKTLCVVERNI